VDNRKYEFEILSITYGTDIIEIRPADASTPLDVNLIFDAMSFNVAEARVSVSSGVFRSLKDQFGV